jgi:putative RNA 2'-phosphotransferase
VTRDDARDDDGLVADSRHLAYVLRHAPASVGLQLDEAGWVDVDLLVAALAAHGRPLDSGRLARLVEGLDKQRFEARDGRIRAAQGHTVPVELGLEAAVPPDVLYHGTVERSLDRILAEGLLPQRRNDVHLSATVEAARVVGARRGRPVVLVVDAARLHAAGQEFRQATNGVWLTGPVGPQWLRLLPGG